MTTKTAGQKRAAARQENKEMRQRVVNMTNQQLKNFLGGFDQETTARLEKAMAWVKAERAVEQIRTIESQIEALTAQKAELSQLVK